ncbi:MAG: hypothetical protein AAF672_09330 [Pseudomonadota bacterium]
MRDINGRHPTAARTQAELIIGLNAIVTREKWYNMTVQDAILKARRATAGRVDEDLVALEFARLVRSVGLEPLEA